MSRSPLARRQLREAGVLDVPVRLKFGLELGLGGRARELLRLDDMRVDPGDHALAAAVGAVIGRARARLGEKAEHRAPTRSVAALDGWLR
jgi:hypothetical protein